MNTTSDQMKQGMAKAGGGQPIMEAGTAEHPTKGDRFRCDKCGMEVVVQADCHCHDEAEHFHCCGQAMHKV
jgi:hypothetical protein